MKDIILKNGSVLSAEDNSNVGAFRIPCENYAAVDDLVTLMTRENLSEVKIGNVVYTDVLNESVSVQNDDEGNIIAIFLNRMSTADIVQDAVDNYTMDLIEGGIL